MHTCGFSQWGPRAAPFGSRRQKYARNLPFHVDSINLRALVHIHSLKGPESAERPQEWKRDDSSAAVTLIRLSVISLTAQIRPIYSTVCLVCHDHVPSAWCWWWWWWWHRGSDAAAAEKHFVSCLHEFFSWPIVRANKTITGCNTGVAEGIHLIGTMRRKVCKTYLAASRLATKKMGHRDGKQRKSLTFHPKATATVQCYMWHRVFTFSLAMLVSESLPSNIQSRLCIRCNLHAGAREAFRVL